MYRLVLSISLKLHFFCVFWLTHYFFHITDFHSLHKKPLNRSFIKRDLFSCSVLSLGIFQNYSQSSSWSFSVCNALLWNEGKLHVKYLFDFETKYCKGKSSGKTLGLVSYHLRDHLKQSSKVPFEFYGNSRFRLILIAFNLINFRQ